MRLLMIAAFAAASVFLSGCTTVGERWAPFPDQAELQSFKDRWEKAAKPEPSISLMQTELVKYRDMIYDRALQRSKLEWDSSGFATYGGVAAVVGALASRTGLVNTGAGIAGLGMINSARYRFSEQTQIYVGALKRMACITSKVNSIDDRTLLLARGSNDANAKDASLQFFDKVVVSVDATRIEYTNALLGLSPGTPTRDEMLALFNKFLPAAPAAAAVASEGISKEEQAAMNAAGEMVLKLITDIQACAK